MNISDKICRIILASRGCYTNYGCQKQICDHCGSNIIDKIQYFVANNIKITFVLPAFPAKSANRNKTLSYLPDYGETMALENLSKLVKRINLIYKPSAEIIICSDGRVFNDLVGVSNHHVSDYRKKLVQLAANVDSNHIKFYDLEDYYVTGSYSSMRELLVNEFASTLDIIKHKIKTNSDEMRLFNGVHRFIYEDIYYNNQDIYSNNQIKKNAKKIAYEVIQRSHAWSNLIAKKFPDSIRLSIHPHRCGSEKLGIQLIANSHKWATPWHNVLLIDDEGNAGLMNRKLAINDNTELVYKNGVPSHYRLSKITIADFLIKRGVV